MGLRNRIKGGPSVRQLVSEGMDIADQVVTDKDALNKLKYNLATIQARALLGGSGFPITKYTICFLCSLVVGSGTWTYLFHPENLVYFNTYALAVVPVIGILTGSYVTGSSIKRKWSKTDEKNNG